MAEVLSLPAVDFDDIVKRALAAATGDAAGAGEPDSIVAAVAQHLTAPIQATVIGVADRQGIALRCTMIEDRLLVVVQPIAEHEGTVRPFGEPRLVFARPAETWTVVGPLLPPFEAVQASPVARGGRAGKPVVPLTDPRWAQEQATVQMRVEAWRDGPGPAVVWARWWSVLDGELYDVRRRDGQMVGVPCLPGSVAAEFEWSIAGAIDVISARRGKE